VPGLVPSIGGSSMGPKERYPVAVLSVMVRPPRTQAAGPGRVVAREGRVTPSHPCDRARVNPRSGVAGLGRPQTVSPAGMGKPTPRLEAAN
jgi:hypothetical protein